MREGQEISPEERDALIAQARQAQAERRLPSPVRMAGNFTKAVVKHTFDGLKKVDFTTYQRRLNQCNGCKPPKGFRVEKRCTHESCGCYIDKKVWWASEECPLGRWDGV